MKEVRETLEALSRGSSASSDTGDIDENVVTTPLKTRSKMMIPASNLVPSDMLTRRGGSQNEERHHAIPSKQSK